MSVFGHVRNGMKGVQIVQRRGWLQYDGCGGDWIYICSTDLVREIAENTCATSIISASYGEFRWISVDSTIPNYMILITGKYW